MLKVSFQRNNAGEALSLDLITLGAHTIRRSPSEITSRQ
jgi:hypothetical protein